MQEYYFTADEVESVFEYLNNNSIKCSVCHTKEWLAKEESPERIQIGCRKCGQAMSRQILNLTITSIEDELRADIEEGMKFDKGKVHAGILNEFKRALMEVARVGTAGLNKGYARGSWRNVPDAKERYMDAFWRHILAVEEINETDGGVYHLAQVAWNAMALLELRLEEKDREGLHIE